MNINEKQSPHFKVLAKDGKARVAEVATSHGVFHTPAFMPVATQASVKGLTPENLKQLQAEIVLSNTYHLYMRPGDELIRDLGGLHKFMGWSGPILTDSGGFQVFSLSRLREITSEGVVFSSHLDGSKHLFTPESVMQIQKNLGVDIMMVLDECLGYPAGKDETEASLELTNSWARRSLEVSDTNNALVFGIVQGGFYKDLREKAAAYLRELPFDGYAVGGLSVGESNHLLHEFAGFSAGLLPEDKPRYLMGVGYPSDIVFAVSQGIDMFDCVIPTRSARFGRYFTEEGYINIRNQSFRSDSRPIDYKCGCYTCSKFTRAYLSHLMHASEVLAIQLGSIHNLYFYQNLMRRLRAAIQSNTLDNFVAAFEWKREKEVVTGENR